MRLFLRVLILLMVQKSIAQIDIKTYSEPSENGYIYYADNNEYAPVSLKVSFKLKNLKSTTGNNKIYVLPARTKRIEISKLTTIKSGKYGFSTSTRYNYGDINIKEYDNDYEYHLPYQKGKSYRVIQSNNGSFSHQGINAVDFEMPVRSKIMASRDGIVISVVDKNNKSCPEEKCKSFNNEIKILHNDGTIARYVHFKRLGSKVKKGDVVKQGQYIADSGNTGWSTDPHLHFDVYLPGMEKVITVYTVFKIGDGSVSETLESQKVYSKDY